MFSDGTVTAFGRGENVVDTPLHHVVRATDVLTPMMMATWRVVFEEVGGFDADLDTASAAVDFAFGLRKVGRQSYYQPAAVGVTSSPVEPTQRLGTTLVTRWRTALTAQPTRPASLDGLAWRRLALSTSGNSGEQAK